MKFAWICIPYFSHLILAFCHWMLQFKFSSLCNLVVVSLMLNLSSIDNLTVSPLISSLFCSCFTYFIFSPIYFITFVPVSESEFIIFNFLLIHTFNHLSTLRSLHCSFAKLWYPSTSFQYFSIWNGFGFQFCSESHMIGQWSDKSLSKHHCLLVGQSILNDSETSVLSILLIREPSLMSGKIFFHLMGGLLTLYVMKLSNSTNSSLLIVLLIPLLADSSLIALKSPKTPHLSWPAPGYLNPCPDIC